MLDRQKKDFKKMFIRGIINTHKNLTAKAQFRVLPSKKGIRLNKENLTVFAKQATVAFPERAEKNQHVANAKGATRWLKHPKNLIIFQWTGMPK